MSTKETYRVFDTRAKAVGAAYMAQVTRVQAPQPAVAGALHDAEGAAAEVAGIPVAATVLWDNQSATIVWTEGVAAEGHAEAAATAVGRQSCIGRLGQSGAATAVPTAGLLGLPWWREGQQAVGWRQKYVTQANADFPQMQS